MALGPVRGGSLEDEVTAVQRLLGASFAANATLRREIEDLQAGVASHELVDLAVGVVMGRLDIGVKEAKAVLRKGAGPQDDKLQRVAAAVVAARRLPSELVATVLVEQPAPSAPLEF
jgi:AmiR/NasT family two-component response regulator